MALSARDFRRLIVQPNLDEYDAEYYSIHRAFNAVAAVDAYAAHVYYSAVDVAIDPFVVLGLSESKEANDISFRQALAQQHAEFSILRDLAKAFKHAELTRHSPSVRNSGKVTSTANGFGVGKFGEGRYGGVNQVFATDETGCKHYVEALVRHTISMLDGKVELLGL